MPYKTKRELPDNVQNVLPAHAQDIYKEAFNSASNSTKIRTIAGMMPAVKRRHTKSPRAAVKHEYEKGDDDKWHKKK